MISLILPGGGARSIAQVGMLKAWTELGIKADMVYGTSAGAINGAIYHQEQGGTDLLDECWSSMKPSDVYSIDPLHWLNPLAKKTGAVSSAPLKKTIAKYLDYNKMKANPTPINVCTTNMTTWKPLILNLQQMQLKDEMVSYILASASIPIAFPCVQWGQDQLCDGGLTNQFPLSSSIKAGADTIVILRPVLPHTGQKVNSMIDSFNLAMSIPQEYVMDRELVTIEMINKIQDTHPDLVDVRIIVVQPTLPPAWDILDFTFGGRKPKDIIQSGYNLAMPILEAAFK